MPCTVHPVIPPDADGSCPWCKPCPIHGQVNRDLQNGSCPLCSVPQFEHNNTRYYDKNAYDTAAAMNNMNGVRGSMAVCDSRGPDLEVDDEELVNEGWEPVHSDRGCSVKLMLKLLGPMIVGVVPASCFASGGATWAIILSYVFLAPVCVVLWLLGFGNYVTLLRSGGLKTVGEEHDGCCGWASMPYKYYEKPCCCHRLTFCDKLGYFGFVKIRRIAGRSSLEVLRWSVFAILQIVCLVTGFAIMIGGQVKEEDVSSTVTTQLSTTQI